MDLVQIRVFTIEKSDFNIRAFSLHAVQTFVCILKRILPSGDQLLLDTIVELIEDAPASPPPHVKMKANIEIINLISLKISYYLDHSI